MRDASLSSDDLAIRAAKEKLATLAERPGYTEAMRVVRRTRTAQLVLGVVTIAIGLLMWWAWRAMDNGPLRWMVGFVLLVVTLFMFAGTVGAAPANIVAVPATVIEVDSNLVLLRGDGTTIALTCSDTLRSALRRGDVGVAHVKDKWLVEFHRL